MKKTIKVFKLPSGEDGSFIYNDLISTGKFSNIWAFFNSVEELNKREFDLLEKHNGYHGIKWFTWKNWALNKEENILSDSMKWRMCKTAIDKLGREAVFPINKLINSKGYLEQMVKLFEDIKRSGITELNADLLQNSSSIFKELISIYNNYSELMIDRNIFDLDTNNINESNRLIKKNKWEVDIIVIEDKGSFDGWEIPLLKHALKLGVEIIFIIPEESETNFISSYLNADVIETSIEKTIEKPVISKVLKASSLELLCEEALIWAMEKRDLSPEIILLDSNIWNALIGKAEQLNIPLMYNWRTPITKSKNGRFFHSYIKWREDTDNQETTQELMRQEMWQYYIGEKYGYRNSDEHIDEDSFEIEDSSKLDELLDKESSILVFEAINNIVEVVEIKYTEEDWSWVKQIYKSLTNYSKAAGINSDEVTNMWMEEILEGSIYSVGEDCGIHVTTIEQSLESRGVSRLFLGASSEVPGKVQLPFYASGKLGEEIETLGIRVIGIDKVEKWNRKLRESLISTKGELTIGYVTRDYLDESVQGASEWVYDYLGNSVKYVIRKSSFQSDEQWRNDKTGQLRSVKDYKFESNVPLVQKVRWEAIDKRAERNPLYMGLWDMKDANNSYSYSVTALERYNYCPFAFGCDQIFTTEKDENSEARMKLGSLIHRCLEIYYKKIKNGDFDFDIVNENVIIGIIDTLWGELDQNNNPELSDGVKAWAIETLTNWIQMDLERLKNVVPKTFPSEFELQISMKRTAKSGDYCIYGKIDRVDLSADGEMIIIDYKQKNAPTSGDAVNNISLQMPIYTSALGQDKVIATMYGLISPVKYQYLFKNPEKELKDGRKRPYNLTNYEEYFETLHVLLDDIVDNIREGRYLVEPKLCFKDYCPYADICRYNDEEGENNGDGSATDGD
ncbi:MAG: PD-(D/E)XK nuclease family protein [Tissierellia bacterium]|nr:PD-(D/E)XK nuclease family protein [Tissierellia bacterium]